MGISIKRERSDGWGKRKWKKERKKEDDSFENELLESNITMSKATLQEREREWMMEQGKEKVGSARRKSQSLCTNV